MVLVGVLGDVRELTAKSGKKYWKLNIGGKEGTMFYAPTVPIGKNVEAEADDRGVIKTLKESQAQASAVADASSNKLSPSAYAEGARVGNAKTAGVELAAAYFQTTKPKWDFGEFCEHALIAAKYVYSWDLTTDEVPPPDLSSIGHEDSK